MYAPELGRLDSRAARPLTSAERHGAAHTGYAHVDSRRQVQTADSGRGHHLSPLNDPPRAPPPLSPRDFLRTPPREAIELLRKHGVTTKQTPGGTVVLKPLKDDGWRDQPDRRSHNDYDAGRRNGKQRDGRRRGRGRNQRYSYSYSYSDYYDYYPSYSYSYSGSYSRGLRRDGGGRHRYGRAGGRRRGHGYNNNHRHDHRRRNDYYKRGGKGGHHRDRSRHRQGGGRHGHGRGRRDHDRSYHRDDHRHRQRHDNNHDHRRGQSDDDDRDPLPLTVFDSRLDRETAAATRIQAQVRGHLARKRLSTRELREGQLMRRGAYHFTDDLINEIVRQEVLPQLLDDIVFNKPDEYRPFSEETRDLILNYHDIESVVVREMSDQVAREVMKEIVDEHLVKSGTTASTVLKVMSPLDLVVEDLVNEFLVTEVPVIVRSCIHDNVDDYLLGKEVEAIYEDILQEAMRPLLHNTAMRVREDHMLMSVIEPIVDKEVNGFIRAIATTVYREERYGIDKEKEKMMESDIGVVMARLVENIALRGMLHDVATKANTSVTIDYSERLLHQGIAATLVRHHMDFARIRDRVSESVVASSLHNELTHEIGIDSLISEIQYYSPHCQDQLFREEARAAVVHLIDEREKRKEDLKYVRQGKMFNRYVDNQVPDDTAEEGGEQDNGKQKELPFKQLATPAPVAGKGPSPQQGAGAAGLTPLHTTQSEAMSSTVSGKRRRRRKPKT